MTVTFDSTPVVGYREGIVIVTGNEVPERICTEHGGFAPGNRLNINDWFTIGESRYNVHPYRSDLGGYPVRWVEQIRA